MSYDFLLTIAIIMLFTKVFGLTSERVHMPQVVGALIAGVLVGPSCRTFSYSFTTYITRNLRRESSFSPYVSDYIHFLSPFLS